MITKLKEGFEMEGGGRGVGWEREELTWRKKWGIG